MRTVILKDKLLKVSEDGTIYRLNADLSVKCEAPIFILDNGKGKYPSLRVTIDGVQKNFYAHRVIAEAFLPNPENLPFCEIVDKNPYNLNIDNLRWINKGKRVDKMLQTRLVNSIECDVCGHLYHKTSGSCAYCRDKERALEKEQARFNNKKIKINEELKNIDESTLRADYAEVIHLRRKGYTLAQIAEKMGVTKQRVSQMITNAKKVKVENQCRRLIVQE